jgi:yecA family protein
MGNAAGEAWLPEETGRLQDDLVRQMEQAGCMPLDVAHGFLTATAAAGDSVGESAIDRVLGGLVADADLRDRLRRFRAQLRHDLEYDDYGPLILELPRAGGAALPLPYGWCQGYLAGIEFLGEGERDRMISDEHAGSLLVPILSFLMYEASQWLEPPDEAGHRETASELAVAAVALHHWREQRRDS